jgi:hypothetical protein
MNTQKSEPDDDAVSAQAELEAAVRRAEQAAVQPSDEASDVDLLKQPADKSDDDEQSDGFGPANAQEDLSS